MQKKHEWMWLTRHFFILLKSIHSQHFIFKHITIIERHKKLNTVELFNNKLNQRKMWLWGASTIVTCAYWMGRKATFLHCMKKQFFRLVECTDQMNNCLQNGLWDLWGLSRAAAVLCEDPRWAMQERRDLTVPGIELHIQTSTCRCGAGEEG